MIWYWIAGLLTLSALALMVLNYTRERRYLKKRTSEAMSHSLRDEIEDEREAALKRKQAFDEAINEANSRKNG